MPAPAETFITVVTAMVLEINAYLTTASVFLFRHSKPNYFIARIRTPSEGSEEQVYQPNSSSCDFHHSDDSLRGIVDVVITVMED